MQIDRSGKTPLYHQIYEYYRREILFGRIRRGAVIPQVKALAAKLSVSASTVRRAYRLLAENGFIQRTDSEYRVVFAAFQ